MIRKHLVKSVWCLPVIIGMLALAGCTIDPPKTFYDGYSAQTKIPLKVALNITDELRNAKAADVVSPMGGSIAANAVVLARATFTDVVEIKNGSAPSSPVDAILTPKQAYFNMTRGATSFGESIIAIKLEWTLAEPDGNTIWVDTISGQSSGSTGWSKKDEMLKNALYEVLRKSQSAMCSAQSIRQFARKKNPDVTIADPPAVVIGDSQVAELCAALDSSRPDQIVHTLKLLRKPEYSAAVPAILALLNHENPNVVRDSCLYSGCYRQQRGHSQH